MNFSALLPLGFSLSIAERGFSAPLSSAARSAGKTPFVGILESGAQRPFSLVGYSDCNTRLKLRGIKPSVLLTRLGEIPLWDSVDNLLQKINQLSKCTKTVHSGH